MFAALLLLAPAQDDVLAARCAECHSGARPKGRVDLSAPAEVDTDTWGLVLEQLELRDMPPEDAEQPTDEERAALTAWVRAKLEAEGAAPDPARLALPRFGNRVPHEELFSGEHLGPAFTEPRLWRTSPHVYDQFARDWHLYKQVTPALTEVPGQGFKDYDHLVVDGAALGSLLRNSKKVARVLLQGRDPNRPKPRYREFAAVLEAEAPTDEQLDAAIARAFEALLLRSPDEAERARYLEFTRANLARGDAALALEGTLRAVVMSPEFLFRSEVGLGEALPDGRRMLGPHELTYAIAYAITDHGPDAELRRAADEGRLASRADVEREVRRLLAAPDDKRYWTYPMYHRWGDQKPHNPRLLRFFREFFGYGDARGVFKDKERNPTHSPKYLVRDADILVLWLLEQDERVFERLIAGEDFFVTYFAEDHARHIFERNERNRARRHRDHYERFQVEREVGDDIDVNGRRKKPIHDPGVFVAQSFDALDSAGALPVPDGYARGYFTAYGLPREWGWVLRQPFALPHRAGMLTHPAWLVAHSKNMETDPVRRGKWVLERLLADSVPDVPIGVDAQVEEDPHRTLRERFEKVRPAECWRCHRKMNPLGEPFEVFDDFGRFRAAFYVDEDGRYVEQGRRAPEELAQDPALSARPVDATGALFGTGDPTLDGPVDDALELVGRLARSERARQSFVRHAFRFWMGRNERLSDSPTLIAMDRAYVENGGSFRELLVALLTSDSFLYRMDPEVPE